MTLKTDKIVTLSQIAAYVNSPDNAPEILAVERIISPSGLKNLSLRIGALMMFICTEGYAKISIDLEEYEIGPDSLVMLNPHNYVVAYDCSEDLRCRMLVCSAKIVENVLPKLSDLMPVLMVGRKSPVLHLDRDESDWLSGMFGLISEKLEKGCTRFLMAKLESMLQAVLYEVIDVSLEEKAGVRTMNSRKEELMGKFILAVVQECTRHRKVEYYAHKLCISPKHLSAVVKQLSGVTAGALIDKYVIMEAKILLKNTDLTVQEISLRLNFANQSFFGKYFKHATGLSPTEYRTGVEKVENA